MPLHNSNIGMAMGANKIQCAKCKKGELTYNAAKGWVCTNGCELLTTTHQTPLKADDLIQTIADAPALTDKDAPESKDCNCMAEEYHGIHLPQCPAYSDEPEYPPTECTCD